MQSRQPIVTLRLLWTHHRFMMHRNFLQRSYSIERIVGFVIDLQRITKYPYDTLEMLHLVTFISSILEANFFNPDFSPCLNNLMKFFFLSYNLLLNGWLPGADTVGDVGGCDVGPIWAGTGTGVGGPGGPCGVGGPWRLCGVWGPPWEGPPGGVGWGGECTGGKALLCCGCGGIAPIICGDIGGGPPEILKITKINGLPLYKLHFIFPMSKPRKGN